MLFIIFIIVCFFIVQFICAISLLFEAISLIYHICFKTDFSKKRGGSSFYFVTKLISIYIRFNEIQFKFKNQFLIFILKRNTLHLITFLLMGVYKMRYISTLFRQLIILKGISLK